MRIAARLYGQLDSHQWEHPAHMIQCKLKYKRNSTNKQTCNLCKVFMLNENKDIGGPAILPDMCVFLMDEYQWSV